MFGDDAAPSFSYTVGLQRLGHPEVVVLGLDPRTAQTLLNAVGQDLKDKGVRREAGRSYEGIANLPVSFIPVAPGGQRRFLRAACALFGAREFSALQMVWPDRAGRFPWHPAFDAALAPSQPLLGPAPRLH